MRISRDRAWSFGAVTGLTAVALVALVAAGTVLTLTAVVRADLPMAGAGAMVVGVAFVGLVVAGWTDGVAVLLLAVPLPALYTAAGTRLTLVAPLTAMLVFGWVLAWGVSGRRLVLGDLPWRSTVALIGVLAVTVLFAQARAVAVREFVNLGVLLALFVAAIELFVRKPAAMRHGVDLMVAIAGICGVLAVLESVGVIPGAFPRWDTPFNRAALGFGQPNALGLFLAVTLPLTVHRILGARSPAGRVLGVLATLAVALGLVATFSRGSWLAVWAGAGALALGGARRWTVRIWGGALLGAILLDVISGGLLRDTVARTIGDWVVEQRAALVAAGVLMFLDHPLLGVGPGGYAESLDRYAFQIPELWDLQATPHNAYVQMAAETGIVGLAALTAFFVVIVRIAGRRLRLAMSDPAADTGEWSLRLALCWSAATIAVAALVVWPFSHGTGQVVVLILAMCVSGAWPRGVS